MAEPRNRFDVPALDGLRALAFGIVFLSHASGSPIVPGGFGVTVFFFLSGYLITTLLRLEFEQSGRIDVLAFFGRRCLRILPPYLLVLAAIWAVAALGVFGQVELSLKALLSQVGFFTNYYVIEHGRDLLPPGTVVYWSLAVEEHFYLVFPLVALLLFRRVKAPTAGWVLLGACAVVLAWRVLLFTAIDPGHAERLTYASDTRIDSILYGCVLALIRNPAIDRPPAYVRHGSWVLGFAFIALAITFFPRDPEFRETLRYSIQGLLLIPVYSVVIARPDLWAVRVLTHPVLRWLGVVSYTLYLVHYSMIDLAKHQLPASSGPVVAVVALLGSVAVAAVVNWLVERPVARWRARIRLSR